MERLADPVLATDPAQLLSCVVGLNQVELVVDGDDGVLDAAEDGLDVPPVGLLGVDQGLVPERHVGAPDQRVLTNRFDDVVQGAETKGVGRALDGRRTGHDHDLDGGERLLQVTQEVDARSPLQDDVHERQVELALGHRRHGQVVVRRRGDAVPLLLEEVPEGEPDPFFVVDDQDPAPLHGVSPPAAREALVARPWMAPDSCVTRSLAEYDASGSDTQGASREFLSSSGRLPSRPGPTGIVIISVLPGRRDRGHSRDREPGTRLAQRLASQRSEAGRQKPTGRMSRK